METIELGEKNPPEVRADAVVFVGGRVDLSSGLIQLRPTRGLPTDKPIEEGSGPFRVELINATGEVMQSQPFDLVEIADATGIADFSTSLPRPGRPIARLRILEGDREVASATGGDSFPSVTILQPEPGATVAVSASEFSWAGRSAHNKPLYYTVLVSFDGGESWTGLLSSSDRTSLDVSSRILEPTSNALLFVSVSDGVNTSFVTSEAFTIG